MNTNLKISLQRVYRVIECFHILETVTSLINNINMATTRICELRMTLAPPKYFNDLCNNTRCINIMKSLLGYSGNACYHSVQNLLSSRLLSRNIKTRIYKTLILPVVLYGCDTWSLTLREEHRLRVFENRVLRRIFGPKRDEVAGG
jgi:hypothetical protein